MTPTQNSGGESATYETGIHRFLLVLLPTGYRFYGTGTCVAAIGDARFCVIRLGSSEYALTNAQSAQSPHQRADGRQRNLLPRCR